MSNGSVKKKHPITAGIGGCVLLPEETARHVRTHAAQAYPHESCGILVGRLEPGGKTVVRWAERGRNRERERPGERYELDITDVLRADRRAREQGLEIVGFYHSHPDEAALPSACDGERPWPGVTYMIVSVRGGAPGEIRCWVWDEDVGAFSEQTVEPV